MAVLGVKVGFVVNTKIKVCKHKLQSNSKKNLIFD